MMYTDKKNVLQLAALLKAYGVKQIVLSPGSRNSPLSHTFATDAFFTCHSVVDERSAGFYALGIIQATSEPAVICCTSGTAVLNYAPAVAEAFYQQLPLLIVTADRPEAHIGQMLGQTLPQTGIYNTLVKKSVHLPEISNDEDEWFCNRLINEAIQAMDHHGKGPVHINIPISEPLCEYTTGQPPTALKINLCQPVKAFTDNRYIERFATYNKRMILIGQCQPDNHMEAALKKLACEKTCVVVCEHLANIHSSSFIGNFDELLSTLSAKEKEPYMPELLITLGGHVVSKRIKQFIRQFPVSEHWHISETGEIIDTYRQLTEVIECDITAFIHAIAENPIHATSEAKTYATHWLQTSEEVASHPTTLSAEETAVQMLLQAIPADSSLHLANSSSVRYAQRFPITKAIHVFCNRGTSGIEGSLSTAVGYAATSNRQTYLLIGDLSFFYDMNGLWNRQLSNRLHIFLINNGCGKIFHTLPGLNRSEALNDYIAATHHTTAKGWAESLGITYLSASDPVELEKQMPAFTNDNNTRPILLELNKEL